ncbi:iron chaperone [Archangium primigenium]|uniref:iron chaperone n=1 Tax=[Archangium] primigenium TaxID=2792470 RepID=UPI00195BB791|nr:DUF1801 domain-containing protein [Archangium primigenium]MBM7112935.1 DUF1801 domain-containing protein [Archangium primigenium]
MKKPKPATIDAYIAALPEAVRPIATQVREAIREAAPDSEETMKYDMPTFKLAGESLMYFAVWKKHVGLYAIYPGAEDFEARVGPYRAEKDTLQFPLNQPLPRELITYVVHAQRARLALKK